MFAYRSEINRLKKSVDKLDKSLDNEVEIEYEYEKNTVIKGLLFSKEYEAYKNINVEQIDNNILRKLENEKDKKVESIKDYKGDNKNTKLASGKIQFNLWFKYDYGSLLNLQRLTEINWTLGTG